MLSVHLTGWMEQDLTSQPLGHHAVHLWAGLDLSFNSLLRFSKGKFSSGKRQAATSSPLVSQSWKEVAPRCLVERLPPQEKQEVRPASGWNVPRAQSWQGAKPSAEYSPGWHRPGGPMTPVSKAPGQTLSHLSADEIRL